MKSKEVFHIKTGRIVENKEERIESTQLHIILALKLGMHDDVDMALNIEPLRPVENST